MAQNATIYKVELSISDMDRHYYETHKLTVAKLVLSRICAAPSARLGHLTFEGQGAFASQC